MHRGFGGRGAGGGRGGGWGGGARARDPAISAKLYPDRGTKVPKRPQVNSGSNYLVQQYQDFIIELQSSVFFVGDHQNDEIQRYSDRNRPTSLGKELAALPAWVPEGCRQQYVPRDILLWLENKQESVFSSKTDVSAASSTEYGQMMEQWRLQERQGESDDESMSDEYDEENDESDDDDAGGDGSDDDNEYSKARGESDDSADDEDNGPVF